MSRLMRFRPALCVAFVVSCATSPAPAQEVSAEEGTRLRSAAKQARDCPDRVNPVPISFAKSDYPRELRRAKVEGIVVVEGIVTIDGRVVALRLVKSPHPKLSAIALDAASRARYKPATCSGQPVPSEVWIHRSFRLNQ